MPDVVMPDVVVVGGGLAGIAAAVRLADAGARVTLLEARTRLGGATYSFRRGDLTVDTGQHVFLRCYTAYRELLARLGTAGGAPVQPRFDVPVLAPDGKRHRLRRSAVLPAPLHLLPAIAGYRALSARDRLSAMRATAALGRVDPDAPGTDTHRLGELLAAHRQRPTQVRRLWEPLMVSALNLDTDAASLALAARVLRTGLLERASNGDLGVPRVPLSTLHGAPAGPLLRRLGATVRTRCRVTALTRDRTDGYRLRLADDTELTASTVVLAVPHRDAAALVPPGAVPDPARWRGLGATAILNVHLVYDRPVTDLPMFAAVDSPVQWVFDRTDASGLRAGQHLAVSLSAADDLLRTPAAELVDTHRRALAAMLPGARAASLRDAFVTREPRATFRQAAGCRALRPPAATALPGLALAGAWTDTGWPDTMEGAVRSGHTAAGVVLGRTPLAPPSPTPDVEPRMEAAS